MPELTIRYAGCGCVHDVNFNRLPSPERLESLRSGSCITHGAKRTEKALSGGEGADVAGEAVEGVDTALRAPGAKVVGGLTPYYEDAAANIRLFLGDAEEVMARLAAAGERFDLIFTSPPYNLGASSGGGTRGMNGRVPKLRDKLGSRWMSCPLRDGYEAHSDDMPWPEYYDWQRRCLLAMWALTDEQRGAIFYNHKPRSQNCNLWTPLDINPGLPLRQVVIWDRTGGMNYTPACYVPACEWIPIFAREDWRLRDQKASGVSDVWRIPFEVNSPHPAPFPVKLPSRAMETTQPGPVFDPFCGSGSTIVAAKQHGRAAVGVDNCAAYLDMAIGRLQQEVLPLGDTTLALPLSAGDRTERWRQQRARGKRAEGPTP